MNNTDRSILDRSAQGQKAAALESSLRVADDRAPFFLAAIESATPIPGTTYRWKYTWTRAEVRPDSIGTQWDFRKRPGETFQTGEAINVCEAANSAAYVGPGYNPANFPQGWTVQPIGGYVLLFPGRRGIETSGTPPTPTTGGGKTIWYFYSCNAIDGVC